uniref:GRIP domain-containing protein n=1 Tax=Meloidogyne javanica TaxID=6303 RepID=A0A915N5Y4_MELJA
MKVEELLQEKNKVIRQLHQSTQELAKEVRKKDASVEHFRIQVLEKNAIIDILKEEMERKNKNYRCVLDEKDKLLKKIEKSSQDNGEINMDESSSRLSKRLNSGVNDIDQQNFSRSGIYSSSSSIGTPGSDTTKRDENVKKVTFAEFTSVLKCSENRPNTSTPTLATITTTSETTTTGQKDKATELKMRGVDSRAALQLFLKENQPSKAVQLLLDNLQLLSQLKADELWDNKNEHNGIIGQILKSLQQHKIFDK